MFLNDYQEKAETTADYPEQYKIIYPALGLNGEAGEVADKVKKVLRDNKCKFTNFEREKIAYELGDVLWYVAITALDLGYTLETIAEMNINKLADRKKRNKIKGSGDNR